MMGAVDEELAIEAELLEERARALGRAGRKVEAALTRLAEIGRAVGPPNDELAYDEAREHFLEARWELIVHREALKLYNHDDLDFYYPDPGPLGD